MFGARISFWVKMLAVKRICQLGWTRDVSQDGVREAERKKLVHLYGPFVGNGEETIYEDFSDLLNI